jgi:hypothetical protein
VAIDPVVALASSLHAAPGTFALLLGSGISRNSGVPTGWDVTVDLARRLATLEGVEPTPSDPIAWYGETHGADAGYSELLDGMAHTPADRRNLLNPYFEPTEDERAQGLKSPTAAHRGVAQLVASGHVRVIVTTNFDRLLEAALVDEGVQPVVIAGADAAAGATPLVHSRCTVIKVHGDYLSPDIRNTVAELERYEPPIDKLLDQVFDEYGLVICGWSGVWDSALRNAILRCPTRRYSTFWAHTSPVTGEASDLVAHRAATLVPIDGADEFFTSLVGKVKALAEAGDRDPLSTNLAIAELKRYLPDPVSRIRLHDLVLGEVDRTIAAVTAVPLQGPATADAYLDRINEHASLSARLVSIVATAAFHADRPEHDQLLMEVVDRLVERPLERSGLVIYLSTQRIVGVLTMYAIGLGALAAQRPAPFLGALNRTVQDEGRESSVLLDYASWRVMQGDVLKQSEPFARHHTPSSDWLHTVLRDPVRDVIATDDRFDGLFDDVEYLWGVLVADNYDRGRGPIGRFGWRRQHGNRGAMDGVLTRHKPEVLNAGFFGGSEEHLTEVKDLYDANAERVGWF